MFGKWPPGDQAEARRESVGPPQAESKRVGVPVETAADEGLVGQPDETVGAVAEREGRMLLTLDLEFADLRKHPPGNHPGIVLFRPRRFGPLAVNRLVEEFLRETDLEMLGGCVVVVDPSRMRVRRRPLDSDARD